MPYEDRVLCGNLSVNLTPMLSPNVVHTISILASFPSQAGKESPPSRIRRFHGVDSVNIMVVDLADPTCSSIKSTLARFFHVKPQKSNSKTEVSGSQLIIVR